MSTCDGCSTDSRSDPDQSDNFYGRLATVLGTIAVTMGWFWFLGYPREGAIVGAYIVMACLLGLFNATLYTGSQKFDEDTYVLEAFLVITPIIVGTVFIIGIIAMTSVLMMLGLIVDWFIVTGAYVAPSTMVEPALATLGDPWVQVLSVIPITLFMLVADPEE